MQELVGFLGNLIFPIVCLGCGKEGRDICAVCFRKMTLAKETLPRILSLYNYHDRVVSKAIKQLKYRGNKRIATLFAPPLYDLLLEELSDYFIFSGKKHVMVIPVPMSTRRKLSRGGNHTEIIARELQQYDKENVLIVRDDILYRTRHVPQQATQKTRELRIKNIEGSFAVQNQSVIRGKKVILLDDVATTGTTLEEAERVLREAGVDEGLKVTLAH